MTVKDIERLYQEYRTIVKLARSLFDLALNDPTVPEDDVRLIGRILLLGEDMEDLSVCRLANAQVRLKS